MVKTSGKISSQRPRSTLPSDHASESGSCPRCQALEARIAELEAAVERGPADRAGSVWSTHCPAWNSRPFV